jgi:hypothetical protein
LAQLDFYSNSIIKRGLGLTGVAYPYSVGSWDNYISMAREHSSSSTSYYEPEIETKGYRRKFGIMTFIHYILKYESGHWETADLWQTRHYPFHSVKEGEKLFCDFLEDLNFRPRGSRELRHIAPRRTDAQRDRDAERRYLR